MAKLEIKYRLEGKALPPRPIRPEVPGWAGSPDMKRENGSEPQPWHCPLFMAGCTYGVELVYQYDTETHIVNEDGNVRIEFAPGGPEGEIPPNDFTLSVPAPSLDYLFGTSLDIQPPPGYVLRVETHPRFYRDHTGTVPAAFCGHVPGHWWSRKLFVVFKSPEPGRRHIFRKGDPYAQVIFIPEDTFVMTPMTDQEQADRRQLEEDIKLCKSLIAKNVWNSAGGIEFNDHFKVLLRAYEQEGVAGVDALVREGVARYHAAVPVGKTVAEYLRLANAAMERGENVEAKEILHHLLKIDPRCADGHSLMSSLCWSQGVAAGAVKAMQQAATLRPNSPQYRFGLAEMYRQLGKLEEAQTEFQASLDLQPNNPQVMTALALVTGQRGLVAGNRELIDEGVARARAVLPLDPKAAMAHYVAGFLLARMERRDEARAAFEAALAIEPNLTPARQGLEDLSKPPAGEPAAAS